MASDLERQLPILTREYLNRLSTCLSNAYGRTIYPSLNCRSHKGNHHAHKRFEYVISRYLEGHLLR